MIRSIRNAEEHRDARAVVADTDALLRVQRQELYERGMSFAQIEEIQHERARLCEEIWEAIVRYENAMCGTVEDITNLEGLGAYLIALRLAKGMSEAELAERIGKSVRNISRLETGVQEATWPTVVALAQALGVSCEAFLEEAAPLPEPQRGRPRKVQPPATGPKRRGKKT